MKIAISSTNQDMDSQIDPRFGRCPFFVIVEIEKNKIKGFKAMQNTAMMQGGGAGITAAQIVGNEGVDAVIGVNFGPRAFDVLSKLGIDIYQGGEGTVKDNVQNFIDGKLQRINAATGPMGMGPQPGGTVTNGKTGMGFGPGAGMGQGKGQGKGAGRGQGTGKGMGPGGGQGRRGNM